MDDNQLLRRFVETGDGDAFRSLVDRYLGLVIGATLRRSGDHSLAEEVAQDVFSALAQKAGLLKPPLNLAAWLHRAAHLQTSHRLRAEYKHKRKMDSLEQHLAANSAHADGGSELAWQEAVPQLDEALENLPETDREIVLQRYFNDLSFRTIAKRIDKSEGATQRQGSRAIAKMSQFLKGRGVTLSAATLTAGMSAQLASPASAALSISVATTATATTTGAATATTTAAVAALTTSLQVMTTTKLIALIATPLLLLAIPVGIHILSSEEDDIDFGSAGSVSIGEKSEPLTAVDSNNVKIDHSDIHSRLAEANKITDLKKRALAFSELIRDLCLQGEADEAWAIIDENPGIVREWSVGAFFRHSGLELQAMIEKLNELPFSEDLHTALSTRAAGISVQKIAEMVDDPDFLNFLESKKTSEPDLFDRFVKRSIGIRLHRPPDPALGPYSDLAAGWYADERISDETFYYILGADKYKDAFDKWDMIDVAGEENVQRLRQATVQQMMEADAEKAVSLILEVEGQQGIADLVNGIYQWGELDAVAASDWFVANESQLSSEQRDSAIFAFVQLAIKHGETDGAEQWASLLKDPAARKAALKK